MTALALVIGLSATSPGIQDAVLVQCHRVEVAAVDLSDFRAHVSQRLNETRFVFRNATGSLLISSLFVQGASPCINSTIF